MFSMLTVFGTLALLASTCTAKATGAQRQDDYYDDDADYYDDDYYGDYGCDVCYNFCMIEVAGMEDEDYDACWDACDEDYYDYYYGEYYDEYYDEDERSAKQMKVRPDKLKIRQREDYSYDDCYSPCEDWCYVSGGFDYDYEFDYDGCVETCEADYYDNYDEYDYSRADKQQQRMTKLKQK